MGRILALDIGTKRTGSAITDDLHMMAHALRGWGRRGYKDDLEQVKKITAEYEIEKIIVGLPLNMNGTEGDMARLCKSIAGKLRADLALDVELLDERLTSVEAEEILHDGGMKRKKMKGKVDALAAEIILTRWLDLHGEKR